MNILTQAATVVVAIGGIGGGALTLDHLHASQLWANQHEAEHRVRTIFTYMRQAQRDGPETWLCNALEEEFINLCTEVPEHYLCRDPDAKTDIKAKAGCE